jgi:hypothetical protein
MATISIFLYSDKSIVVYFINAIILAIIVFFFNEKFSSNAKNISVVDLKINAVFKYMALIVAVWAIYLLTYYPGLMTYDSYSQFKQAITMDLSDWHPATHTILISLLIKIWYNPAVIASFNIVLMALACGYFAYILEKFGFNKVIIWIWVLFIAIIPVNGFMVVTLWKDITFSAGLLFIVLITLNIYLTDGKWLDNKLNITFFIIATFITLFSRHNGLYNLILFFPLLIFCFKNKYKTIIFIAIFTLTSYFIITVPVYKALDVKPVVEGEKYSVFLKIIDQTLKNGSNISYDQKKYFNSIMSLKEWEKPCSPYCADSIKNAVYIHGSKFLENKNEFYKNFFILVKSNPRVALKAYLNITSMIWSFNRGKVVIPQSENNMSSIKQFNLKNENVFYTESYFPNFKKVLDMDIIRKNILFRPVLSTLLLIFSMLILIKNYDFKITIVFSLVFINQFFIMFTIPAQDFRYLYINFLTSGIAIVLAFYKKATTKYH